MHDAEEPFIAHGLRPMNPVAIFAARMPQIDPAYIVLATLLGSLILFVTEALRFEVIAVLVVLVLAGSGCLTQQEAFAGFASPAIVLIASMYVFGYAFTRWGVAEAIGNRFLAGSGGEAGLVLRVVLVSGLLSAVLSNTGVVATLIPVCSSLARRHRVPVSRLLMPMSFGTLLGGLITVIATSKNIAVNEIVYAEHGVLFSLFEFSHFAPSARRSSWTANARSRTCWRRNGPSRARPRIC